MIKRKFLMLIFLSISMYMFMPAILAAEPPSDDLDLTDFGVTASVEYPEWSGFDMESPNIADVRVETIVPMILIPVKEELTDEWGLSGQGGIGYRSFEHEGSHYYNVHSVGAFSDGIAAMHWGGEIIHWRGAISLVNVVGIGNEAKWSRIDTTGAIIEDNISEFYNNLFYDRYPPDSDEEPFFSEGLMPVVEVPFLDWRGEQQENGEWTLLESEGGVIHYVDEAENVVLRLEGVVWAGNFHEGRAVICIANDSMGVFPYELRWGVIDKKGELIVPFDVYSYIGDFKDGLAIVERNGWAGYNGQWGFIDRNGNEVVPAEYISVTPFNEGLAAAQIGNTWSILQVTAYACHVQVTFGATRYILNNEPFEQDTLVYNGVAYLPAAYLATKLGLTAQWDAATNTTMLTSSGKIPTDSGGSNIVPAANPVTRRIWAAFGATRYYLDGELLDEQTIVYNGAAYLPAAYLATKLGLTAQWDAEKNITTLQGTTF